MGSLTTQSIITLRDALPQDIPQIAALGSHVFSVTFGHSVSPHELQAYLDESYSLAATEAELSSPSKDMIVAVDRSSQTAGSEARIVGFALLTRGSSEPCIEHLQNTVELQRIYVHPDCHGKGVGRLLADRLEDMAREQGFEYMWLGVWEENHKAMKVYEKLGYERVGDHDFVIGGVVQTDHIMVKRL
jgi:ribosomal protein S18 acetylase RimI-like enzyme